MASKHWTRHFEQDTLQQVIKPLLTRILQDGVSSKAELADRVENDTGYRPGPRVLDQWLAACELAYLFEEKPLIKLPSQTPNTFEDEFSNEIENFMQPAAQASEGGEHAAPTLPMDQRPRTFIG